jgi:hypothetical protein
METRILILKGSEKFFKEKETSFYRTHKPFALINTKTSITSTKARQVNSKIIEKHYFSLIKIYGNLN